MIGTLSIGYWTITVNTRTPARHWTRRSLVTEPTGHETEYHGSYGHAYRIIETDPARKNADVSTWLITIPNSHPFLTQWLLSCCELRTVLPGHPPAKLQFPGATHEILEFALNPDHGPYSVDNYGSICQRLGGIPLLQPVNLVTQFEATDNEMKTLLFYAMAAVCNGQLAAEPPLGYESFRDGWKQSLVKTLAHIRGEAHAP
jgi:hypothetical protein